MLGIEPRDLHMLDKCVTTGLQPQTSVVVETGFLYVSLAILELAM